MRDVLVKDLARLLGADRVISQVEDRLCYSYDGTYKTGIPRLVVKPGNTEQVAALVEFAYQREIPLVPRGAGTGLSGGSVPLADGVVVSLTALNRVVELDRVDMLAVVEAGVVTGSLHKAAEAVRLFYPPDPASSAVSTIGGNVAECAGGPRGLKYGVTRDYVLGLEVVLPDGRVINTGGRTIKNVTGYDLTRLITGSEGTLGIITRAVLRLLPLPEHKQTILADFLDLNAAATAITAILAEGIVPAALEIMDDVTIRCVEKHRSAGLPLDAAAILLMDLDGPRETVGQQLNRVGEICRRHGARNIRVAHSTGESAELWQARRAVSPALVQVKPTKISEDATVPRSQVPAMIRRLKEIAARHNLDIAIFGHAGDGNLHPNILVDRRNPAEMARAENAIAEIFEAALALGGTLSGEHGIGLLKRPYLKQEVGSAGMEYMTRLKQAFDPKGIMNPGKILGRCASDQN